LTQKRNKFAASHKESRKRYRLVHDFELAFGSVIQRLRGMSMSQSDLRMQMAGYGLATIQIHYYMPDHPSLLQQFLLQQYDLAPRFPELKRFLDFWRRDIDAVLHSVQIAHQKLIGPTEWRAVNGEISIH
jgi:uncharacterized protein Usg